MLPGNSPTRGVTLVELLIGLALLAIIMTLSAWLFTSSWQRYHVINVIQDVKLSGIRGMERFGRDFNETSLSYITIHNNYDGLTQWIYFPPRRSADGTFNEDQSGSSVEWKTWILYYLIPANVVEKGSAAVTFDKKPLYYLVRKVKDLVPKGGSGIFLDSGAEVAPEVLTLKPVMTNPATGVMRGGEVCARNITSFTVDTQNCGAQDVYQAVIEAWGSYGGKKCTSKVERVFLLRNL
jgi:prepilin-type N-terminal cleavage/methylation domain-containing protein